MDGRAIIDGFQVDDILRARINGVCRVVNVTGELAAEIDLDKILTLISEQACQALACERATIFQYDPVGNSLYTKVALGLEVPEIRRSIDRGIAGHAARLRQIVNVSNPQKDPRWDRSIDLQTGYQTRNVLAAPLVSPRDGSLLGVLQALNNLGGDFDAFDEQLMLAFSHHAAIALDRAHLVQELQARKQITASLNVAREVQRQFMPRNLPQVPNYEFASWWLPNEAVGGDYCDVLPMANGRTAITIADVSGHGLGPSLLMASVRAALRSLAIEHFSPVGLMELLARAIAQDLQDGRFITMVLASLDHDRHLIDYANAGHAPAEWFHAATGEFHSLESTGIPLGAMDDATYTPVDPIMMGPSDLLILGTDGIIEAMDDRGEMFGLERLRHVVAGHAGDSARQLVERIGSEVAAFLSGRSPDDDVTVIIAKRIR